MKYLNVILDFKSNNRNFVKLKPKEKVCTNRQQNVKVLHIQGPKLTAPSFSINLHM